MSTENFFHHAAFALWLLQQAVIKVDTRLTQHFSYTVKGSGLVFRELDGKCGHSPTL